MISKRHITARGNTNQGIKVPNDTLVGGVGIPFLMNRLRTMGINKCCTKLTVSGTINK